jgi:hypothetical protein
MLVANSYVQNAKLFERSHRALDDIGGGNLLKRSIDTIGGGNLLRK